MANKNRFWFWLVIVLVLAFLAWIVVQIAKPSDQGQTVITDQEWIKGGSQASVTLVEYSDFQCPACAAYYRYIQMLNDEFGDQVQIIFRHYPLDSIHPQADLAARASEAAGQQDQFWAMHDMLFANQSSWSDKDNAKEIFVGYASELGLDIVRFENDIDNKKIKQAVKDDKVSGNQAFVEGTPTFYLNGEKISNPRSYDKLRELVREQLN